MRSTFRILFYLNTSKRKKSGLCPVMGRITVDGGIAQFSLKEDAHPAHWDAAKGRMKGNSRETVALNRKIEQTEQSIRKIYAQTVETSGFVTAEQIKNELTGVVRKSETLLELFREHNREYEKRVGIDRRKKSHYAYVHSCNHLSKFIKSQYNMDDYPLKQLDMTFIENYDYYLRVNAGFQTRTLIKNICFLKKMIARAISRKIILHDPFPDYEKNKIISQYQHISEEELKRVMSTPIQSKSVCFVRDMFVFSCFTGLAYADVRELSEKHLRKMADGTIWIEIPRYKTKVLCSIPLLDIPIKIIEKYQPERKSERIFNMFSNSYVGLMMHEIANLCGIKHLHFHMARHTFATLICLSNNVSFEGLGKMMGHKSIRTTQIYGEITNQKVSRDMEKLVNRNKEKILLNQFNHENKNKHENNQ